MISRRGFIKLLGGVVALVTPWRVRPVYYSMTMGATRLDPEVYGRGHLSLADIQETNRLLNSVYSRYGDLMAEKLDREIIEAL